MTYVSKFYIHQRSRMSYYTNPSSEDLLCAFMLEPEDPAVPPVIPTTAGKRLAGIAELVVLIFEEMFEVLLRQRMPKRDIIAASMASRLWRDAGVPIIYRRQIIGNRQQLARWVSLSGVAEGKFWRLCDTLFWNGQEARWRKQGEKEVWFETQEVRELMQLADFSRILELRVFGTLRLGNVILLGDMVRRMGGLRTMTFTGSQMDPALQREVLDQVGPSIKSIHSGTWCARNFQDNGRASSVEVRGDTITSIFRHRVIHPAAVKDLTVHLASPKEVRELKWMLRRFTNVERLTCECFTSRSML